MIVNVKPKGNVSWNWILRNQLRRQLTFTTNLRTFTRTIGGTSSQGSHLNYEANTTMLIISTIAAQW